MKEIYLVTGGAGFIGSNIVEVLLNRNHRVRILDNFSTGKRSNLDEAIRGRDSLVEIIEGDIRELKTCQEAVSGVSFVLHQAALPSVPRSVKDPLTTNDVNIRGTLNMLIASRDEGVGRFVFASSSSVYGDTPVLPKVETMSPNPLSPYALSKLAGELYARIFYNLYRLPTVCLRYFNIHGPRQDPESQYAAVIPKFISAVISGESPTIFGDGEQTRDFTYVEDCVEANLRACRAQDAPGRVFNIACGRRITINELFKRIRDIVGSDVEAIHGDKRPGDIRDSLATIRQAQNILGYSPAYDIEAGLRKSIEWFRDRRNIEVP